MIFNNIKTCLFGAFLVLLSGTSISAEASSLEEEASSTIVGIYTPAQKEFLASSFIDVVNIWLRRYDPTLISRGEDKILMQAKYSSLFDIELNIDDEKYEISARLASGASKKRRSKRDADHLVTGINRDVMERLKWEIQRINFEEGERETEERRVAALEAAIAEDIAIIANIKSAGPLRAYPALGSYRYKKCQRIADLYLDVDVKNFKGLFESGLESIKTCASKEESALAEEVRLALANAPARVSDQIKDLHAYTVASLRALTNFHQSAIEARQERSNRSAGINERTTRVELEL